MEREHKCDWCNEWATHITRHERKNAGTLVAYWCDLHYQATFGEAAQERADEA